jgi:hypothetical protein
MIMLGKQNIIRNFVRMLQIISIIFISLDAQLEFAKFAYKQKYVSQGILYQNN